jgi:hypothetical protein
VSDPGIKTVLDTHRECYDGTVSAGLPGATVESVPHCECREVYRNLDEAMGHQSGRQRRGSLMGVYMGIDWSKKKHDLTILDEGGKVIAQTVIPHQKSGFRQLDETRTAMKVAADACLVGMETAHNVLIDYLWKATTRCMWCRRR